MAQKPHDDALAAPCMWVSCAMPHFVLRGRLSRLAAQNVLYAKRYTINNMTFVHVQKQKLIEPLCATLYTTAPEADGTMTIINVFTTDKVIVKILSTAHLRCHVSDDAASVVRYRVQPQ